VVEILQFYSQFRESNQAISRYPSGTLAGLPTRAGAGGRSHTVRKPSLRNAGPEPWRICHWAAIGSDQNASQSCSRDFFRHCRASCCKESGNPTQCDGTMVAHLRPKKSAPARRTLRLKKLSPIQPAHSPTFRRTQTCRGSAARRARTPQN
jgi:hypothetical protein